MGEISHLLKIIYYSEDILSEICYIRMILDYKIFELKGVVRSRKFCKNNNEYTIL